MNRKTNATPIRNEQAPDDLMRRAEDGDSQAQFDSGMYDASASLNPALTPAFETMRRQETCTSRKNAPEWWLKSAGHGNKTAQEIFSRTEKCGFEDLKNTFIQKSYSVTGDDRLLP